VVVSICDQSICMFPCAADDISVSGDGGLIRGKPVA